MALSIDHIGGRETSLPRKPELLARLPLALAGIAYVFLMGVVFFA